MRESRSASQVLFGYLPEQTVDLRNGVWKVKGWRNPKVRNEVDTAALRREIVRHASAWRANTMDRGFVNHLEGGAPITVVVLDVANGVEVEPFPKSWMCKVCRRIHDAVDAACPCGATGHKGQLYFVGFHDQCGSLKAPWIPRCRAHRQVRVTFPGTSSANEIKFDCPVCSVVIRNGFGHVPCDCGQGNLTFQPHRASSVYTARSIVLVNPPSKERMRAIADAGGPPRALSWLIQGMLTVSVEETPTSRESLRRQLEAQGLLPDIIQRMLDVAGDAPGTIEEVQLELSQEQRSDAETQAVTVALATLESRVRIKDLETGTDATSDIGLLYRVNYPEALKVAGLSDIDLIERFPILTGNYGYTRGDHTPGASMLVPFRERRGRGYCVYADIAETEAMFVRLNPLRVAKWLERKGHNLKTWDSDPTARAAIIQAVAAATDQSDVEGSPGYDLLTLVHSYAHRFLRIAAVRSGIDRNALSELLVPLHLGFFIYAAARGDFVLGGLQAVFESDLHRLLDAVVYDEHRCALDPGCMSAGGACMACLHIGEPSCRLFNRNLSRSALFGQNGFLRE